MRKTLLTSSWKRSRTFGSGGRTEPLVEKTKTLINAFFSDKQQGLEMLHKAAAIEHCRYPVDFSKGSAALVPHIGQVRKGAKLLELEAILSAENGRGEQAVRSLKSALALGRSLSKEPLVVSQLARVACQTLAVSGLERVINRTELADEQILKLSQLLADAEQPCAMSRAFVGERCRVIDLSTKPAVEELDLSAPAIAVWKLLGLFDRVAIRYLDIVDGHIDAAWLPLHQRYDTAEALDAKLRNARLSGGLDWARVTQSVLGNIAGLRTARVALAVQRHRLAEGKFVDTLAELVPTYLDAVPKDPFDGEDMRYERLAAGYVVYSVGEDLSDDGGKEQPPRTKGRRKRGNYDITFIVER
jgi:hypothetical protein